MTPVFLGGVIKYFVETKRHTKTENVAEKQSNIGVLLSSGLIAGEGIMGVLIAGYAVWTASRPEGVSFGLKGISGDWLSFIIFSAMGYFLFRLAVKKQKS